jgi:hypothetical protein
VIVLDHNIPLDQANLLGRWHIHFRQIGFDVGRPEWDDQQEILRHLHRVRQATFFTRDMGFFRRRFCHKNYCLVVLSVPVLETAVYIRRLLRHLALRTRASRRGKVIKVSTEKIVFWKARERRLASIDW